MVPIWTKKPFIWMNGIYTVLWGSSKRIRYNIRIGFFRHLILISNWKTKSLVIFPQHTTLKTHSHHSRNKIGSPIQNDKFTNTSQLSCFYSNTPKPQKPYKQLLVRKQYQNHEESSIVPPPHASLCPSVGHHSRVSFQLKNTMFLSL